MHLFWIVFCIGGVIFFFIDQAAKVDSFTVEALTNNLYHFFIGFIILLGANHLKLKYKFKTVVLIVVGIIIMGEVYDYLIYVNDFTLLKLVYNLYVLFWGTICGFAFSRWSINKQKHIN